MKKCEYCAKEISYHEMYCDEDCQRKANAYYDLKEKFSKLFMIVNGICVLSIGIFIFAFSFFPELGLYGASGALIILGLMYFFLPFPPEIMINKYKIEKSLKICRIIAIVLFVIGVELLTTAIIVY
ncbi:MAG: DUF2116 family Zn-ribbon domain-containing protein [Ruminococcus sp.]|nr:DUF2116 family Zn-ribbon domain-containing protein [Ruminococcus sp.]